MNAIEHMGRFLDAVQREILPELAKRWTEVPVVPEGGPARNPCAASLAVLGGYTDHASDTVESSFPGSSRCPTFPTG